MYVTSGTVKERLATSEKDSYTEGEWMLRGCCLGNLSWEVDLREWQLPSLVSTLPSCPKWLVEVNSASPTTCSVTASGLT